jgi:hypothetical protein
MNIVIITDSFRICSSTKIQQEFDDQSLIDDRLAMKHGPRFRPHRPSFSFTAVCIGIHVKGLVHVGP